MKDLTANSCRICFSQCKRTDIQVSEVALLYESIGSQLHINDIPKKICESCLKKLKKFVKFKEDCMKADKFLEAYRQHQIIEPKLEIDEENDQKFHVKSEEIQVTCNEIALPNKEKVINVGIKSKRIRARKSTKEKPTQARVICELCGKDILKSRLSDHIGAKHQSKRFVCDLCGCSYVEKANLIRHMFYKHLKNQRQYPCPYCDKIYEQSGSRSLHIKKIHTNDLPHVCETCGKRFVKPSKLKYHLATHSDVRNVPCPLCDSMFRSIKDLMGHRSAVHSNRTYTCQICSENFKNSRLLKVHKMTHNLS
uniref:CSON004478 protein n=1 Tax=Culicoides sonorensis TaxID=179676 RepID=A0A336M5P9_CULSO